MTMSVDEAKDILNECVRSESRDHAFGDCEIYWDKDGTEVAFGYFGGSNSGISIIDPQASFEGEEAQVLRECGKLSGIFRNDETGPDTFVEGETMPGLSKGDVFHELTGSYLDES